MRVAFGLKTHSGWAALVVVGMQGSAFRLLERRRIALVGEDEAWACQPYHAAENLPRARAREIVNRGVEAACRGALREMRAAAAQAKAQGHRVVACAVLVPEPMPAWSIEEILAVHFRMHKAEGVLFPDALCRAARECGMAVVEVREKHLQPGAWSATLAALGKKAGPPWGRDQKSAALAALTALDDAR